MRCHSLRLDSVRAGTDDAVSAVYARLDPGYARAAVGAASAWLEAGRVYGSNGGDEEEDGGFELHRDEWLVVLVSFRAVRSGRGSYLIGL